MLELNDLSADENILVAAVRSFNFQRFKTDYRIAFDPARGNQLCMGRGGRSLTRSRDSGDQQNNWEYHHIEGWVRSVTQNQVL